MAHVKVILLFAINFELNSFIFGFFQFLFCFLCIARAEVETCFPYRDVKLQSGSLPDDIYDVSKDELGR